MLISCRKEVKPAHKWPLSRFLNARVRTLIDSIEKEKIAATKRQEALERREQKRKELEDARVSN